MAVKIVMNSKLKEYCNAQEKSVSGDFYEAFNNKMLNELDKCLERATGNGRKTVQTKDL